VANALAYHDTAKITAVKRFVVQAPGRGGGGCELGWLGERAGPCTIKLFTAVIYRFL
jgi:hypothetical protein